VEGPPWRSPIAGKPTRLVWVKRVRRCRDCRASWRETHPEIAPHTDTFDAGPGPRHAGGLTGRARREAARQVGEDGMAVAAVARDLGVAWDTVMRAVVDEARDRFDRDGIYTVQTRPCLALGVDEKVMNRATRGRRRRYVTVLVNLATGRPVDIVPGRSKRVPTAWLAAQTPAWRSGVKIVALDRAAPYRAALEDPDVGPRQATLVVDRFRADPHDDGRRARRARRRGAAVRARWATGVPGSIVKRPCGCLIPTPHR
jgi:transposase